VSNDSVTIWLRQLGQGDQDAARQLWDRYSPELERLARSRFRGALTAVSDEQDLVQSVFRVLWTGAAAGQWDSVQDRSELWWLLLAITRRKALKRLAYNSRLKRGETTVSLNELETRGGDPSGRQSFDVAGDEPPPELILMLREEQERLLAMLRNEALRTIAVWKLEGYTHEEIAGKLGVAPRTVIRKLNLIRETWSEELQP